MSDGAPEPILDGRVQDVLERLFRNGRTNALVAWLLISILLLVFTESTLDLDFQWMMFVAVAGVVVLIPPVAYRDWRVMLPWEVLLLALLPILVRGVLGGSAGIFAAYLSVAALALIVTVELHMFTSLRVTHWFAVAFVALTTLAWAAAWGILRWHLDRLFGTTYLLTNEALMIEFLWVTLAGITAGVLFDVYFRRRDRQLWRVIQRAMRR